VSRDRMLSGLDELLTAVPLPAERSSSMVLITGPSRTADIEQTLIRGVHGPKDVHVVFTG
jgi:L-lactate dehydrogenase complex protein LldG